MFRVGFARPASALAALAAAFGLAQVLGCPPAVPAPVAGMPDYQAPGFVPVPFGQVNVLGGNLLVQRRDLDFDTRLGNVSLGATWNSADASWRYAFELSYDGARFVDASGARYDAAAVANGQAIPGSVWVRVDARTLKTKGGLVHEFDASGRLAAVRWSSATYPRLEYRTAVVAGAVRVTELRQLARAGDSLRLASFGYDAAGRLTRVEDRTGRRAELVWNAAGQLAAARDALDLERGWPGFRYEYAAGALAAVTSSEGVRAEYAYLGSRLRAVRAVGEGDPRVELVYGSRPGSGFTTSLRDPFGHVTRYTWDGSRRLLELRNPLGERSVWTWAGLRPASLTTPAGVVTRWSWSGDDPAQELQPSGNAVAFTWEPGGENRAAPRRRALRRASDSVGALEENAYDAAGRLVRATNGAGESRGYGWNADNLLGEATDPAGIETRYRDYGDHGRPQRVERGGRSETFLYDAVGNLRSGSGSAAFPGAGDTGVVSRSYDADRNLVSLVVGDLDFLVSEETRTVRIERRSDGQPTRIERPYGADSEFAYDALGRLRERRDRSAGVWRATRFELDLAGRATAAERPNGMRTELAYDPAGRRASVVHLRAGVFQSGAGFAYVDGRLAAIVDAAHGFAEERYAYDAAGRVLRVSYPDGEALELGYDRRSRVILERYLASGGGEFRRLAFDHDLANREVAVRDGEDGLRSLSFAEGRLAAERFGNGLVRSYAYGEADGLLAAVSMRGPAGEELESTRLRRETDAGVPHVVWHASTQSFGALAATTHEWFFLAPGGADGPGMRAGGFASDAAGEGVEPVSYDALGNLLQSGFSTDADRRSFHYDAERTRLLRVEGASGGVVHRYAYDEAGFVVERDGEPIVWDGGGRPRSVGSRASLAWDALGRLVSVSVDGAFQRRLFGGRVRASAGGIPLGISLGNVELDLFGAHRYRHLDFRGNVKLVSDAEGRIVSHVRYALFGADRVHGAADPEAGFAQGRGLGDLVLLGARLHDPEIGRFLAPDPVVQILNQYAYADGNPVWYWDPDGRSANTAVAFALGVGVVGTGAGVAVIAVAAIGTGIAAPLALAAGVSVIVFSEAFMVGAVAPSSDIVGTLGRLGGGYSAIFVRQAPLLFGPIAAAFGGFAAGQSFRQEFILTDPTQEEKGCGCPADPNGGPGQSKELELRLAVPDPGCSPASLTRVPVPRARRWIGALLVLQGILFGAWLLTRRTRDGGFRA
jgi:RHS repeat-associated protein